MPAPEIYGSVATFKRRQVIACSTHIRSGCQIEKVVDELNLSKKIIDRKSVV